MKLHTNTTISSRFGAEDKKAICGNTQIWIVNARISMTRLISSFRIIVASIPIFQLGDYQYLLQVIKICNRHRKSLSTGMIVPDLVTLLASVVSPEA